MNSQNRSITALKGVKVGHITYADKLTGCTLILFRRPLPVSYVSHGGTPRIYDGEILQTGKSYPLKHGIFISDGAHAGLETAAYIAKRLREKKIGWRVGKSIMPSLTGACIYSLGLALAEFDPEMGYEVIDQVSDEEVKSGNVGAGTGASVGKFSYTNRGLNLAMKTGVGNARMDIGHGVIVTALTVLNALGNIVGYDGKIIAGNRDDKKKSKFHSFEQATHSLSSGPSNTTISIVGINVDVSQEDLKRIAEIASHGQVRAIDPINTSLDGDSVFAFTTKEVKHFLNPQGKRISRGDWYKLEIDMLGQAADKVVQASIYDACYKAEGIEYLFAHQKRVPSFTDLVKLQNSRVQ